MTVLFLYTELADYTLACFRALKNTGKLTRLVVVHYPVNAEAPFEFDFGATGEFISLDSIRNYRDLKNSVDSVRPDKIVVSGWANKWYLRICTLYRRKATCILTMDNHWAGSLKQRIFQLGFRLTLRHIFKKIWVPGQPQVAYARKLGFGDRNIMRGFYCCDTDFYLPMGEAVLNKKLSGIPKRLLCVARYVPQKNYRLLWDAFIKWKEGTGNDWELWCAGTGEEFDVRVQHPAIRHLGFIQKDAWKEIIDQTGVFILPSCFEPWGVAVHEFAALGYPLILSARVGAASSFLNGDNGFSFAPDNPTQLIDIFERIERASDAELWSMGRESHRRGGTITTEGWAQLLLDA